MYEDIKHTYIKFSDDTNSEGRDDMIGGKHHYSNCISWNTGS